MSNKFIFEDIQRKEVPYYSDPMRAVRVEHRDLPKSFLDKIKKLDEHLRFEFWNTGECESERGVNAKWRCFRFIGPHHYEHVRWFEPWQVPGQYVLDWLNESDMFRHGPETINQFKRQNIEKRKAQDAEKNKKLMENYDKIVLGERFDEVMREETKDRFGTRKLYSWQRTP